MHHLCPKGAERERKYKVKVHNLHPEYELRYENITESMT